MRERGRQTEGRTDGRRTDTPILPPSADGGWAWVEGARVSKGTVAVAVVVSAASFIVNSRISQAHLGAGFLPVRSGNAATERR